MASLPNELFGKFKKMTLTPVFAFFKSDKGNNCMRKAGPIIVLLHIYFFTFTMIPILQKISPNATIMRWIYIGLGYFLLYKCLYMYYKVIHTHPGSPKILASILTGKDSIDTYNIRVASRYSQDLAEVLRYQNVVDYETLEQVCAFKCDRCKDIKPVRTHHCSVCNQCVMLMDHHCLWTNTCIGLNNYKYFLQLNLFGMLGAYYTACTLAFCQGSDLYERHSTLFQGIKILDILIGKFLLILIGWNMYVCFSGYTNIEYKSLLETQVQKKNSETKLEEGEGMSQVPPPKVLYQYGFKTLKENFVRAFGTDNYVFGFLFVDLWNDRDIKFNGSEWTTMYYWEEIEKFQKQKNRSASNFENLDEE